MRNENIVHIGSEESLPIEDANVSELASHSVELAEEAISDIQSIILESACGQGLFEDVVKAPLPSFRAVNHEIPLIDETKTYHWQPSKCPEPLLRQWIQKKKDYLSTGHWKVTMAQNTVPMLCIFKPNKPKNLPELCTVFDLREWNTNTCKMVASLASIDGILRHVASCCFCSLFDLQAVYEQIHVVTEHLDWTVVTTPDGNMMSLVMQQGNCNAPATCQALINHLFSPYIGVFMDVYLDDIIVYSNTIEKHVKHCEIIFNILQEQQLYLSEKKCQVLEKELRILGHIVNDNGIKMDPSKVDTVLNWKIPINRELLSGFLGLVGYLADNIDHV